MLSSILYKEIIKNAVKENLKLLTVIFNCLFLFACSTIEPGEQTIVSQETGSLTEPQPADLDFDAHDYSGPEFLIPDASFIEGTDGEDSESNDSNADATSGKATQSTNDTVIEAVPVSIWNVYRNNTLLDLQQDNPRIKSQRDWYAKHQRYIDRVVTRAEPYLYYILDESIKRGIPSELILLPIVESAYDPFAYSHGRAAGIWQFIPGTARAFGLKQTWWYEGRRDIVASTNAAMDYLESLHKQFDGDWMLALASYNSGAGTVRKAIRKNKKRGKPTDFWALDLPKETRAYVPKLIAIAQIFNEPEKYNISLAPQPYQPYFAELDIGGQLDLALAAKMAGLTIEELYRLNPAFNRWATDPDGPHHLLVPIAQAEQMKLELANLPPENRVAWNRYTIQKGDSILSISRAHNITPALLKEVNHLQSNRIRAGKTLLIPQSSKPLDNYTLSADERINKKLSRTRTGKHKTIHVVKSGESFWSISRKYNVNHRSLAKWNGLAPTDTLSVGRKLVVWSETTVASNELQDQRLRKIRYRARSGDSYAGIADKFNISLGQLKSWNQVDFNKYLQPGDMLTLYVDVANAP